MIVVVILSINHDVVFTLFFFFWDWPIDIRTVDDGHGNRYRHGYHHRRCPSKKLRRAIKWLLNRSRPHKRSIATTQDGRRTASEQKSAAETNLASRWSIESIRESWVGRPPNGCQTTIVVFNKKSWSATDIKIHSSSNIVNTIVTDRIDNSVISEPIVTRPPS